MAMASLAAEASSFSTPPSPRSWTYHVFLSFRGEDTRTGFTDHLCASLERKGITTFRDDKDLERGQVISLELLRAIQESMFAVVVLSPNYASSAWCLDELQKIVECKHNLGLQIVPVFYGVEPSDVRHQKGTFDEAFRKHEHRFGEGSERVRRWRDAFAQIASYSGWDSKHQLEARFVESISEHIHRKLIPKLPSCTKNRVGIASRLEEVINLIGIGLNDVRFLGIWGMGGIGKTTIARAVYEAIRGEFKVCCFMRNVRELSAKNGFVQLQRDLLACLNINSYFHDIEDGKSMIKSALCNKKVLLVLDDVSELKQLENLAENQDWFGPGSRIIITARDMHLLDIHGVHGTYEVKGLDQEEAYNLFCLKAFKQLEPKEGYSSLGKEVVKYTKGLPLAVEVLGSYLYRRNAEFWHSTIREIMNFPHFEVLNALKISYNHLMPTEKNIFLDIACFFKGMEKDEAIHILRMCDFCVGVGSDIGSGIVTLIDKALVTLDQNNKLEMHDLLQEMGRHIVYKESPCNPGKRSRLWSKDDIHQVLTNDLGTEAIQSMVLSFGHDKFYWFRSKPFSAQWSIEAFSKTTQLRYLSLPYMELPLGLNHFPSSVRVLHWDFCPLETLPLLNQQYQAVEIKMQRSNLEQVWHGKKFFEKLKYLDLSSSRNLKQTPDISGVPILETFDLQGCDSLTEVHISLVHHKNLVHLNLSYCEMLKTLPGKLEMSSLKELIIEHCESFENPPEFGECMRKLSKLSLSGTPIGKLPSSLGNLVGLEDLNIKGCGKLDSVPDTIHRLKSLKNLDLGSCFNLHGLPSSISSLPLLSNLNLSGCYQSEISFSHDLFCYFPSLMHLDLSGHWFANIPISIHELSKLRSLKLNRCGCLQFLPKLPSSIRELEAYGCRSLNILESNVLSTICTAFKSSSSQDQENQGVVLEMLIPSAKIPSLFVNYSLNGNDAAQAVVPYPSDCRLNKNLKGIAVCFLFYTKFWGFDKSVKLNLSVSNGNRCIIPWRTYRMCDGYHLYILCLTNDYFRGEFHRDMGFKLLLRPEVEYGEFDSEEFEYLPCYHAKVLSTGWTCIEDIEDLNKSEIERQKNERQSLFDLNKSIEIMDICETNKFEDNVSELNNFGREESF
ncbi:TMV resistance protein N [Arachis hypogaea]|nr:TMV resistance protein N [Arachis hypogaea]